MGLVYSSLKKRSEYFIENLLHSAELTTIGEGQYGTIYTHPECPEIAVKIFKDTSHAAKEFEVLEKVAIEWDMYTHLWNHEPLVQITHPYVFHKVNDWCCIAMDRVCNVTLPVDAPVSRLKCGKSVHAFLGNPNHLSCNKNEGVYIGQRHLRKHDIDLVKVSKELGKFMGMVHYKLNLDGSEIELLIGKKYGSTEEVYVFVTDFGRMTEFDMDRAICSLHDTHYFPLEDGYMRFSCSDEEMSFHSKLATAFHKSYLETAKQFNSYDNALKVLRGSLICSI